MFNVTSRRLSSRVRHLLPWHCCSYIPMESLGDSARMSCYRFATTNYPCASSPLCKKRIHHCPLSDSHPLIRLRLPTDQQPQTSRHSNHSGTSTFFQRESPLLLTTSHKPPNPRLFRPNGDDSYGPRLGDLPPFRNSDYFLVSTPVDVDDLVFWKRKTRTMANVRHVGNTSSPSTVIVQYVASRASVLRPNLAAAAEAEDRLHAPSDSGCPFPSLTSFYNHGFGAFHAVLFDLGAQ